LASPCGGFLLKKALSKTDFLIETRRIQANPLWRAKFIAVTWPAIDEGCTNLLVQIALAVETIS
jgi:hypothetical protein